MKIVKLREYTEMNPENTSHIFTVDLKENEFRNLITDFVFNQVKWSINENGVVERNNIIKEWSKFLYLLKIKNDWKNDEVIEAVKDEYHNIAIDKGLTKIKDKKEFYESLKPQKFKYNW